MAKKMSNLLLLLLVVTFLAIEGKFEQIFGAEEDVRWLEDEAERGKDVEEVDESQSNLNQELPTTDLATDKDSKLVS